jgi:hypothetical protein
MERLAMALTTEVLLYGNSLFLAGIRAELEQCHDFDLTTVAADSVPSLTPDRRRVILLDFAETSPDLAVNMLRQHPEAVVIGVDPSSYSVLVLSHAASEAVSLDDLVKIIRQEPSARAGARQIQGGIIE